MRRLWVVGIVMVLIGCAGQSPETDEPILATPIVEATEMPITVTSTPEINTPTTTASATPTPSGIRIEPIAELEEFRLGISGISLSPTGRWFNYNGFETEHFHNLETGEQCSFDKPNVDYTEVPPYTNVWAWLDGDRVLVRDQVSGSAVVIDSPCDQIQEGAPVPQLPASIQRISPAYKGRVEVLSEQGFFIYDSNSGDVLPVRIDVTVDDLWQIGRSPQGTRIFVSKSLPPSDDIYSFDDPDTHTWIIDAETGAILDEIDWGSWVLSSGTAPIGPRWLDENRLIFSLTYPQGALMLTVGQGITNIATELFRLDCAEFCHSYFVSSQSVKADGTYHIKLTNNTDILGTTYLYHSETGEVEVFDTWHPSGFSPDGNWINMWSGNTESGIISSIRAVDPAGSEPQIIDVPSGAAYWHPDSERFLSSTQTGIVAYTRDGQILGKWRSPIWPALVIWSLDGQKALVIADPIDTTLARELYVITMPDAPSP